MCTRKIRQINRLRCLLYNHTKCSTPSRLFTLSAIHHKPKRFHRKLLDIDPLRDKRDELYERMKTKKEIQFIEVYAEDDDTGRETGTDSKLQSAEDRLSSISRDTKLQSGHVVDSKDNLQICEHSVIKHIDSPKEEATTLDLSAPYTTLSSSGGDTDSLTSETVPVIAADDDTPVNILGDLDAILGKDLDPEDIPLSEIEAVESLQNVDYNVYMTPWQGERTVYPEVPLDNRSEMGKGIPLNHAIQYIRDAQCFDTEIIETAPGMFVKYVIITSVSSARHLKTIRSSFPKMCRDEYNMTGFFDSTTKSRVWLAFDTGQSLIHFMTYDKRVELNLESLWLGLDEEEGLGEEEVYTSNLLQGLFPDEDITKLAKPFELVRDEDN